MKYVQSDGGIWKLTLRAYERMLKDLKEGRDINLNDYGSLLIVQYENLSDIKAT